MQFNIRDYDKFKINPKEGVGQGVAGIPAWISTLWDALQLYIASLTVNIAGIEVNDLIVNNQFELKKGLNWIFYSDNYKWKIYPDDEGVLTAEEIT